MLLLDCYMLTAPDNGTVSTPSGTTVGETADYSCNDGFNLIGAANRRCQESGLWSESEPSCIIKGKLSKLFTSY